MHKIVALNDSIDDLCLESFCKWRTSSQPFSNKGFWLCLHGGLTKTYFVVEYLLEVIWKIVLSAHILRFYFLLILFWL